jgi:hypothetical protein
VQELRDGLEHAEQEKDKQEMARRAAWRPRGKEDEGETAGLYYDLAKREPELKIENEELQDQLSFLQKYFGVEARDRIRREVNIQKTAISEIKEQINQTLEELTEISRNLTSGEMHDRKEKSVENVSLIRSLTHELDASGTEKKDKKDATERDLADKSTRDDDKKNRQEILMLSDELKNLEAQKAGKRKTMASLERQIRLERAFVERYRIKAMMRERSVYRQNRFGGSRKSGRESTAE